MPASVMSGSTEEPDLHAELKLIKGIQRKGTTSLVSDPGQAQGHTLTEGAVGSGLLTVDPGRRTSHRARHNIWRPLVTNLALPVPATKWLGIWRPPRTEGETAIVELGTISVKKTS